MKNSEKNVINIITKIDTRPTYKKTNESIHISCKSFAGIPTLKKTISNYIEKQLKFLDNKVYISSQRQFDALQEASIYLKNLRKQQKTNHMRSYKHLKFKML